MSTRYVVLGLARPRSSWFSEVGRWATGGSAPIEFIRCVSREEVAGQLASGRSYSALLVDGGHLDVDRDLVDALRQAGSATIVVEDRSVRRDWSGIGAAAMLAADFSRTDLVGALDTHATPIERTATGIDRSGSGASPTAGSDVAGGADHRWISVVGGGSGGSLLSMALAQGLADRRAPGEVLLADLALDADQAMLHAAPDIVPGVSELVEAHRRGRPDPDQVRDLTFAVDGRGYRLLLGLRRHRDWAALRPRALDAGLRSLGAAFPLVVADVDGDLEGEAECGSVEVEERNGLARAAVTRADVVVVIGTAQLQGLHRLLRTIDGLRRFGVEADRLVPVVNHAQRSARSRAEITRALGELTAPVVMAADRAGTGAGSSLAGPLFVPSVRRVDTVVRDGARLPDGLGRNLARAVAEVLDRVAPRAEPSGEPVAVRAGELGLALSDRAAS